MQPPIKLFVCEFITGGGFHHETLPYGLLNEGQLMRDALLNDLAVLGYEVMTTHDARLPPALACHQCQSIGEGDDVWQRWESIIEQVDAVWCIAPETYGLLEKLTGLVVKHHKIIVGSDCESIHVTSDKLITYQTLAQANIATIPTLLPDKIEELKTEQWVAKPRYGAGCEETHCFESARALSDWVAANENIDAFVVQPFQAGEHASISCLINNGKATVLSCNKQLVNRERGLLQVEGVLINGKKAYWSLFDEIANQVAQAVAGLSGYVGIDVIVTQAKKIVVVEVNPRLTTSYIGLKEAIGLNPAALCMQIALGGNIALSNLNKRVVALDFTPETHHA